MKKIIKLTIFLGIVSTIAALLLFKANEVTKDKIAQVEKEQTIAAMGSVLPEFDNQPVDDSFCFDGVTFYLAKKSDKVVAIAAKCSCFKGFGGEVEVLVGLHPNGDFRAVVVTKNNETPGLGTNVTDRKTKKTIFNIFKKSKPEKLPPNKFLDQFTDGHQLSTVKNVKDTPVKVKKDDATSPVVEWSSATVTSRAVLEAVSQISNAFKTNKQDILSIKGTK